jgi:protein TonB
MKTIEKAFNAAVYAENLEDIIFDGRNQKYGAYTLRKNYNNHLLLSLLAVFIVAALSTGIPFINALLNPPIPIQPKQRKVIVMAEFIEIAPILDLPVAKTKPHQTNHDMVSENTPIVVEDQVSEEKMMPQDEPQINNFDATAVPVFLPTEPVAAAPEVISDPNPTYTEAQVTEQASFKGGSVDNFRKWLARNIYYPLDALDNEIKGTVFLKFAIDKLGKICDITVVRGIHPVIDQAAIDALERSPKWAAATIGGRPVKITYCIPVAFDIQR